ncbi:MAG: chorismate mutase [Victivallaceae bacterium]|nr:chorismate mutase [Victivallaceae bacterium]
MTQDLKDFRAEIDGIDAEIAALLDRRCRVSLRIGEWKKAHGVAVLDAAREKALLERIAARGAGLFPAAKLAEIYRLILESSRQLQEQER